MSHLQNVFNYQQHEVRTVLIGNDVWFVAKDVCEVLGLSKHDTAISRLNDSQKGTHTVGTLGGNQNMSIVNESGLYKLIFTSRKPEAEKFSDWVTGEVLPSIRKHGMYATDELLDNPDLLIQVATKLKEEREKRIAAEAKNLMLEQQVAEYEPKVTYVDQILKSQDVVTIT